MHWWNDTIAGNELWRIAALAGILLAALLGGRLINAYFTRLADRANQGGRRMIESVCRALASASRFAILCLGISRVVRMLVLPDSFRTTADSLAQVLIAVAIGYTIYCLVDIVSHWLDHPEVRSKSRMDNMLAPMVRKSLRVTVVILTLVQVAQILSDKPITSILAGLGIGGLAVALAAQETIKNFFGSLVILADKPFELGDLIVVDDHTGSVEAVGFRSTRLRTLDGELVTLPNGNLANLTVRNIGKRPHIRRLANITITYDTPPEKVERAVAILKEILHNHEGMHPDFPPRVHFNEFNDSALNLQVLYWYHPAVWWNYMAFTERFNLEVFRRFAAEGIEFAFPTQTVFLAGDPKRPLPAPPPV